MKKSYATLIFFLLLGSLSFSQTTQPKSDVVGPTQTKPTSVEKAGLPVIANSPQVFEKNPLPINQKGAPAIFYVANDQAVDRKTHLQQLRPGVPQN